MMINLKVGPVLEILGNDDKNWSQEGGSIFLPDGHSFEPWIPPGLGNRIQTVDKGAAKVSLNASFPDAGIQGRVKDQWGGGREASSILVTEWKPKMVGAQGGHSLVQAHCWDPDTWLYGPTLMSKLSPGNTNVLLSLVETGSVENLDWINLSEWPPYLQLSRWTRQDLGIESMDLCPALSHCFLEPEQLHLPQLLVISRFLPALY